GTQYNDVFGFFISGPGITGTQNLAVLPNSSTPVTINSINQNLNSQYYIDNDYFEYLINGNQLPASLDSTRFANLEYDGLTTVLTARAHVQPGQTYKLTLAIEDIGDDILDAGVFIKGGSITSGPCPPSVSIAAAPGNTICTVTNVTFTATPTNGGTPSYQWKVNGVNAGTNSNTFQSSTLVNGDVVTVVMTSSLACANPTTATSNSITMSVTGTVAPSVSIAAAPGNTICTGTNVTFTATPTNGGTPSYQWKVNGVNAGTNSNTFQSSTLVNGDVVTVVITSSLACANPITATSNSITMAVNPNVSAGMVTGSTPLAVGSTSLYSSTGTAGGSWSSTNTGVATVNAVTGMVTAVSVGTTNITYTVGSGCGAPVSAFQTLNVTNNSGVVACGPKGDKVVVCHNGHEICIAAEALPAHLAQGD